MDIFYAPWLCDSGKKENNNSGHLKTEDPEEVEDNVSSSVVHLPPNGILDVKPLYKLTFFNAKGGAETTRLMLIYLQIPFIDNRIAFNDFHSKEKHDLILQQMPLLELQSGDIICNSTSVARFVAKEHGLLGTSNLEQARADEITDNIVGLINGVKEYLIYKVKNSHLNTPKNAIELNFVTKNAQQGLDRFLPQLEQACSRALVNEHGFILASGISFADFTAATAYEAICEFFPLHTRQFKALQHVVDKIRSLPQLQYYLQTRQKTRF